MLLHMLTIDMRCPNVFLRAAEWCRNDTPELISIGWTIQNVLDMAEFAVNLLYKRFNVALVLCGVGYS